MNHNAPTTTSEKVKISPSRTSKDKHKEFEKMMEKQTQFTRYYNNLMDNKHGDLMDKKHGGKRSKKSKRSRKSRKSKRSRKSKKSKRSRKI